MLADRVFVTLAEVGGAVCPGQSVLWACRTLYKLPLEEWIRACCQVPEWCLHEAEPSSKLAYASAWQLALGSFVDANCNLMLSAAGN